MNMRVFGIFEQVKTGASGGKDFPAKEFCKETRKREKESFMRMRIMVNAMMTDLLLSGKVI